MTEKQLKKSLALYNRLVEKNISTIECEFGNDALKIVALGKEKVSSVVLPDIGNKNMMSPVVNFNTSIISLHKAILEKGYPITKTVRVAYRLSDALFKSIPRIFRGSLGFIVTTNWFISKLQRFAHNTQNRSYPDNFVMTVDKTPDRRGYVLVAEECTVRKMYAANDVEELVPYCSFFDYVQAKATGMGLSHTYEGEYPDQSCTIKSFHRGEAIMVPKLKEIVQDIKLKSEFKTAK